MYMGVSFYVYGCFACVFVCMCTMCMPVTEEARRERLDPLELEL